VDPIFEKLEEVVDRLREVEGLLSDPQVASNQDRYRGLTKEHAELSPLVEAFNGYRRLCEEIAGHRELLQNSDAELKEMAKEEIPSLEEQRAEMEQGLKLLLLPKDPNDEKNVILEIRAGTGGDEAALFAGSLFRMYGRYAERQAWRVEILSCSESDAGGMKEVIAMVSGQRVYSRLKYESGTHRVQRVPETETQGRMQTSMSTSNRPICASMSIALPGLAASMSIRPNRRCALPICRREWWFPARTKNHSTRTRPRP